MSSYDKFKKDLKIGEVGERLIAKYLNEKGYKILGFNNDMDYDVLIENKNGSKITLEIKCDRYELYKGITNNMFLEINCNGKKSGILGTKADYFIYFYPEWELAYMIKVKDVIELIRYGYRTEMSGDDGKVTGVLINRFEFEDYFKIFSIKRDSIWDRIKVGKNDF